MITESFDSFASRHGLKMHATYDGRTSDGAQWDHDQWTVTISKPSGAEFSTTFRMGTGHNGKAPDLENVLTCLASDARDADEEFEDWSGNLGYDTDSRKAEATWKECQAIRQRLAEFFGATAFEAFLECEEDGEDVEDVLHDRFREEILPLVKEQYEQDGAADYPARSEAFNDWTDSLCTDGEISTDAYETIGHPAECGA